MRVVRLTSVWIALFSAVYCDDDPASGIDLQTKTTIFFSSALILSILAIILILIHIIYSVFKCIRNYRIWKKMHPNYEEMKQTQTTSTFLLPTASLHSDRITNYAIKFENICYTIDDSHFLLKWIPFIPRKQTPILNNVTGVCPSGSLTVLLGSTGCGKTTLLDILAGIPKQGSLHGHIWLGDKPIETNWSLLRGYVSQESLFMETMTVYEMLEFTANLRLPEKLPFSFKKQRIEQVMQQLQISHLAKQRIGGILHRGISGGEKRRLSIAVELIADPPILFLDEPTSNIDSYTSFVIMNVLSKLVREEGKTIICSIHQPSRQIFELIDQLVVMDKGQIRYIGPAKEAKHFFESLDGAIKCSSKMNTAEYVLETVSKASFLRHEQMQYHFKEELEREDRFFDQKTQVNLLPSLPVSHFTTFYTQWYILSKRAFKNFILHPLLMPLHVGMNIIMGLLLGWFYFQMPLDFYGTQDRIGCFFFIATFFGLSSMTAVELFISERNLFKRERSNGFYCTSAYFLAKLLFDIIPLRVIPPIFLATIAYWMMGLRSDVWPLHFGIFVGISVAFNVLFGSVAMLLSAVCSNVSMANFIALVINFYSMLFGGFLVNTTNLPEWINNAKYISAYQYFIEALMSNEFTGRMVTFNPRGFPPVQIEGEKVLLQFGFSFENFPVDLAALLGMIIACFVVTFLYLFKCVKERR